MYFRKRESDFEASARHNDFQKKMAEARLKKVAAAKRQAKKS